MLLSVNPVYPEPRKIRRAAEALEAGEVIGYPTDTVYGIGCDLFSKKAIDRLYQIKEMDHSQKLALICPDFRSVARYAIVEDATFASSRSTCPAPTLSSSRPPARCRKWCKPSAAPSACAFPITPF